MIEDTVITKEFLEENGGTFELYTVDDDILTFGLDYESVAPDEIARLIKDNGWFAFATKLYCPETGNYGEHIHGSEHLYEARLYICPGGSYTRNREDQDRYFFLAFTENHDFAVFDSSCPKEFPRDCLDGWFDGDREFKDLNDALANHTGFDFDSRDREAYDDFALRLYRLANGVA